MGNKNSSPPPPPPPCHGPDLTSTINYYKNTISDNVSNINKQRDYTKSVSKQISDNVFTYLDYADKDKKIQIRFNLYKNETTGLLNTRNNIYSTLKNLTNQFNTNLELLSKSKDFNLEQIQKIGNNLNTVNTDALKSNDLDKSVANTTIQYYDSVHSQNYILNNNRDKVSEDYSIDDGLVSYLSNSKDSLSFINNIMFLVYYLLIIVLLFFIYNKNMSVYSKIALFVVLILFPFYVTQLQNNLRLAYSFLFIKS
jgi:hypothetical protein